MHQTAESSPKQPTQFCSNLLDTWCQGFLQSWARMAFCNETHLVTWKCSTDEKHPLKTGFSSRGVPQCNWANQLGSGATCPTPIPERDPGPVGISWGILMGLEVLSLVTTLGVAWIRSRIFWCFQVDRSVSFQSPSSSAVSQGVSGDGKSSR